MFVRLEFPADLVLYFARRSREPFEVTRRMTTMYSWVMVLSVAPLAFVGLLRRGIRLLGIER